MDKEYTFKIENRVFIYLRGHITIVANKENIPITNKAKIIQNGKEIDIISAEKLLSLECDLEPVPRYGIVTKEPTTGDTLIIKIKENE